MDTSTVEISKHTSSRRRRRMRTAEEKRAIVEEVLLGKESVAVIARRHEVNANLVFAWKRQHERDVLKPTEPAMVPVKIGRKPTSIERTSRSTAADYIEIELGDGKRVRVGGAWAREVLDRLITELCR